MPTLHVVADGNMPHVEAWLTGRVQSLVRQAGRTLSSADLAGADVLLVRSVTQVNQALLQGTPVRFVGSATIGTDHIDLDYLQQQQIPFAYAPGCNAQSVADWLLSILSRLHLDHDLCWWQQTIGVVGVGNVGSVVVARLRQLGVRVLVCDPEKHQQGLLPDHLDLAALVASCDILCLHTPHTRTGPNPTDQLFDQALLATLRPGAWLINAGRGPVVVADALLQRLRGGELNAVLDVWPEEPRVPQALLAEVALASPHVAGYSLEGRANGTAMIARQLAQWAGLSLPDAVPRPPVRPLEAGLYYQDDIRQWASELVLAVYDPARDTATLGCSVQDGQVDAAMFDSLRKHYPTRRELHSVPIAQAPPALRDWLSRLGFSRFM
ncbi:4-phosphoerythronate dehydrogenase [Reinekea sp.]|jgi:erythronate-4-phosphate dehydrogenase|uniref:4-phosphoerythronate dehydrogenase n=1 Tax=Reinekea sp. TaxID=1970455 RepID=UPI002A82E3FB|nr:4-phosphoerythronate dehydrogenase [Reinekea sp.]